MHRSVQQQTPASRHNPETLQLFSKPDSVIKKTTYGSKPLFHFFFPAFLTLFNPSSALFF